MGRLWNGIRALPWNRSSERLAHDDRGRPRSVGAAIIAGPLADFDEAEPLVQRERRRVVLATSRNIAFAPAFAAWRRFSPSSARPTPLPAQGGVDGDGENLRFVRRQPRRARSRAAARSPDRAPRRRASKNWRSAPPSPRPTRDGRSPRPCRRAQSSALSGRSGRMTGGEDRRGRRSWGLAGPSGRRPSDRLGRVRPRVRRLDVERARGTGRRIEGEAHPRDSDDVGRVLARRRGRKAARRAAPRRRRARRRRRRARRVPRRSRARTRAGRRSAAAPAGGRTPRTTGNRPSRGGRRSPRR